MCRLFTKCHIFKWDLDSSSVDFTILQKRLVEYLNVFPKPFSSHLYPRNIRHPPDPHHSKVWSTLEWPLLPDLHHLGS